ncbi:MAG: DUF1887 family protein [Clostridia bacterium]|nr:DUF1887 family protein [Clostridia bacterium]
MTYVEFFDKNHIDNICSALMSPPERIVFVSRYKPKTIEKHIERYRELFSGRGVEIEFEVVSASPYNISEVIETLTGIVRKYPGCVIDLTGGGEVFIVAAATVCERYREMNIQMHRYNVVSGKMVDCDADGKTILTGSQPQITVEENVRLYGGRVLFENSSNSGATHVWDDSVMEDPDVAAMWKICKTDPAAWNTAVSLIELGRNAAGGKVVIDDRTLEKESSKNSAKFGAGALVLEELATNGIIDIKRSGSGSEIVFKNDTAARCLAKAGNMLELYVYILAKKAEKNGEKVYTDVLTGVTIDNDGVVEGGVEVRNEVDVVMQRCLRPVFVSCKNGIVTTDELYKLNTVAKKFGGKYSRAAIVIGQRQNKQSLESLKKRADSMDIRVIEVYNLSEKKLAEKIANLGAG